MTKTNLIPAALLEIDSTLFRLVKDLEILLYINPTNTETEKKKFFSSGGKYQPQFKYKELKTDFQALKRQLNRIPIEQIEDEKIELLYERTIRSFCDRIDIISSVGTKDFLKYNLRYFGEPQKKDVDNASYILYCPDDKKAKNDDLDFIEAKAVFDAMLKDYGFDAEVIVTKKIVSKAMVKNQKKQVLLKHGAVFNSSTLHGTAHHEIGVHMVTTMNSNLQPLKIFNAGFPMFTKTQEGIAIMAEYLSGNLSVRRLKELAARVIAIHKMINGESFQNVFAYLTKEVKMNKNEAFYLTTRVYRGGGCTKDHLYLKGFSECRKFSIEGGDLKELLIGKTSLTFLPIIHHMMEKKMIIKPKYITKVFKKPKASSEIVSYILNGLK